MSIVESNIWGQAKEEINGNALNKNGDVLLGSLDANGNTITNLSEPQNDGDAVNMAWVKNWQPPWTYTEGSLTEKLFSNTKVSSISSSNASEVSDISDGFYIINNGSIRLVCKANYGSYDGYYFKGTFSVYKNNDVISSYSVARNQFGIASSTPDIIDIIIDVKKGDVLRFGISGNFVDTGGSNSMSFFARAYVDMGNPYKYSSFDSAVISTAE